MVCTRVLCGKPCWTVAKRRETWPDHLQLVSAVKVDGEVSALAVMPQRGENDLARYFAVGDDNGKVYIFRPDGDLVAESDSGTNSSVTALGALLVKRNETIVTSGHANGDVVFHRISESLHNDDMGGGGGDDMHTLTAEIHARQSVLQASPAAAAGMEARAAARAQRGAVGNKHGGAGAGAGRGGAGAGGEGTAAAAAAAAAAAGGNGGGDGKGDLVPTDVGGTTAGEVHSFASAAQMKTFN